MRKLFAVLAVVAFAAACSDQPTQPAAERPQLATAGSPNGAWVQRYSAEDMFCGFWDDQGNPLPPVPCTMVSTPAPSGLVHMRIYSDGKIPNASGRTVRFGPTNYPTFLSDWYMATFGIGPTPEGLMPLCDWNVREYPGAWSEFPIPADKMPLLICSTNWHFTISAAGKGMLVWVADPARSWRPFATP